MSDNTFSKEIIKKAIVAEIDGQKFYRLLIGKAKNPEAKRKLEFLAQEEVNHEAILIDLYRKLHGEEVDELPHVGLGVLSKFFAENRDKEDLSEVQYIDLAVEAELGATNYYKDGIANAPNDEVKQLCERMAGEEYKHFEMLKAERETLSGNYSWFDFGGAPLED